MTRMSDIKQALAYQRKHLKIRLWAKLSRNFSSYGPSCIWCSLVIKEPDDAVMHEWLIKRNALPVKLQYLIMHEYNCVLAHNDCHHKYGQTTLFKMRSARAQYKRYGRDKIVAWVESLSLRQTVWIPTVEEVTLAAIAEGFSLTEGSHLSVNPYWLMEE